MEALKPLKILWASNATDDFGYDHQLMQGAYESGCRGVLIGLESLNSSSLKSVEKRLRDADKYREIIDNIHSCGLAVNGCFVLGFDSDTEEELPALPERVDRLVLDLCRFASAYALSGNAPIQTGRKDRRKGLEYLQSA